MKPETRLADLLEVFRRGTEHLGRMAASLDVEWKPELDDPRRLHNNYARNLIASYTSKTHEYCEGILYGLDTSHYLVYALCARSLLETVATLRYYVRREYLPLLEQPDIDLAGFNKLIEIDDKHFRGTGFNWPAFLGRDLAQLRRDVQEVGKRGKKALDLEQPAPVRVGTTIKDWANENPDVMVTYVLLCDLVHPNIGSNMLVGSTDEGVLRFTKTRGDHVGRRLVEMSFPLVVVTTQKEFGDNVQALAATVWHDSELEG
jgi:hypothetical protein